MEKIETRILWWMTAVALLSLLLVGTIGGFWPAISYAAGLALAARGYWVWFACRPRLVCERIRWYDGTYAYWEVTRG